MGTCMKCLTLASLSSFLKREQLPDSKVIHREQLPLLPVQPFFRLVKVDRVKRPEANYCQKLYPFRPSLPVSAQNWAVAWANNR